VGCARVGVAIPQRFMVRQRPERPMAGSILVADVMTCGTAADWILKETVAGLPSDVTKTVGRLLRAAIEAVFTRGPRKRCQAHKLHCEGKA